LQHRLSLSAQKTKRTNNNGLMIASDTLKNGRFVLKEEAIFDAERMTIGVFADGFSSAKSLPVWVAPKRKVKINGEGKLHALWDVKSSISYQKEENLYQNKSRDIVAEFIHISIEINNAYSKYDAATSNEEALLYNNIADSLSKIRNELKIKELFSYVDIMEKTDISPIWLSKMKEISFEVRPSRKDREYYSELRTRAENLYNRISEKDKTTILGYHITARIFPPPVAKVGDDFVDTDLINIDENTKTFLIIWEIIYS